MLETLNSTSEDPHIRLSENRAKRPKDLSSGAFAFTLKTEIFQSKGAPNFWMDPPDRRFVNRDFLY